MLLRRASVERETQHGSNAQGEFFLADTLEILPGLLEKYAGQVQIIYIDPPFMTGGDFSMRVRVGEKEWKSGVGSLHLPAYKDLADRDTYLARMRKVLLACRALLSDTGSIFVHVDYRAHAHVRLLMDEIFGEQNLLNEIIWAYQSGGRARRYFSRKHDIILFYRKTCQYYFDIESVPVSREGNRRNHMKRHMDADGRVYRSIRSGGKIYTYYDDDPTYPGDVWDDVSHLQQKDPQRTGYDTQKPVSLLERVIRCASKENDLVMDLFSGSGTTMEAASRLNRRFVGADNSPVSLFAVRRRMLGANAVFHAPPCEGSPAIEATSTLGIAYYDIEIGKYQIEQGLVARTFPGLDALDNWSAGYLRDGAYEPEVSAYRTKARPALASRLMLPLYPGQIVLRTCDVLGRAFFWTFDKDGMENS